jgi:rubrerythrin
MPSFGDPFSSLSIDQKLTKAELVRTIRFLVSAEYEAIQMYMQVAEAVSDKLVKATLIDIADEERVHAGEFLRLLHYLAPDEQKFYAQGYAEVEAMMKRTKK